MQHYKLLMQVLNKRHLHHIEAFKKALKIHSEHVQERQKRVGEDNLFTAHMSLSMINIDRTNHRRRDVFGETQCISFILEEDDLLSIILY